MKKILLGISILFLFFQNTFAGNVEFIYPLISDIGQNYFIVDDDVLSSYNYGVDTNLYSADLVADKFCISKKGELKSFETDNDYGLDLGVYDDLENNHIKKDSSNYNTKKYYTSIICDIPVNLLDNSRYIGKYIFTSEDLRVIYVYELGITILIMIFVFFYKILNKKNYNYLFNKK